ncbi:MAG: hypothetical protein BGO95_06075 [Micrococcales bacterium 73-13]|nr:MAG: hypothetical protein BGO95_06075 [Micrococcales bacterium 73-13]
MTETVNQLEVSALVKRFGDRTVVDDLAFAIGKGEFFTLLGPSGCGKSTTLMMIAGLESPDAGTIRLRGDDVTRLPPERRRIGVVFQNYALFPHMSIVDNVAFGLRMHGQGKRAARAAAEEMLDVVELTDLHRLPAQLSGGQMQRVALARALVTDPDLLLMDEPLSALDRRLRQTMQFELRRLQAKLGTTVLYVTHDQEEALVLSDRIAVMNGGRFEQVAPPAEVYTQPVSAFVAGFLGESNQLRVRLAEGEAPDGVVRLAPESVGGRTLLARRPVEAFDEGLLVVRPECMRIASGDAARAAGAEGLPATVDDVTFLGDHLRVGLLLEDGTAWTAQLPPGAAAPTVGSSVRVEWDVQDAAYLATAPQQARR